MKINKSAFACCLFYTLFFQQVLFAQNTSPYWSLAGNSNATATSSLGTTNAQNLRIITNNSLKMIIQTSGNIGIGTSTPSYKLHVTTGAATSIYGNGGTTGILGNGGSYGVQGTSSSGYGVYGSGSYGVWGSGTSVGVYGTGGTYGVYGSGTSYGLYGSSSGSGVGVYASGYYGVRTTGTLYGVFASSSGGTGAAVYGSAYYGLYGSGTFGVYGGGSSYGVYGYGGTYGVYGNGTSYGVRAISDYIGVYATTYASNDNYAGYFSGNVYCSNTYLGSDAKLKKNIRSMDNGLDIINKLQPKNYEFREDGDFAEMKLPKGNHYGLIAQDIEKVLPNLVKETHFDVGYAKKDRLNRTATGAKPGETLAEEKGAGKEMLDFKAVNYVELIPILVKATQELSTKNDELTQKNEYLYQTVESLKQEVSRLKNGNVKDNLFSNERVLSNSPNPFSGNTTITYSLPVNFTKAQIAISDNSGKVIKTMNVAAKGRGTYNLDASGLSAGTYNYSLIVDGKTVSSKQFVLAK